jgi:hypothetical protein
VGAENPVTSCDLHVLVQKAVARVSSQRPGGCSGRGAPRRDISRGRREAEAGSVAYVVLAALGLDISSSTVECVADWSHG